MVERQREGTSESGSEKVRQKVKGAAESIKAAFTVDDTDLTEIYFTEIEDIFDAEHRILEALTTMSKSAASQQLQDMFDVHRAETQEQIRRLEQIFDNHARDHERETCEGVKGLIDEATETMKNTDKGSARDAAMIASAQTVEHYEMARYGTLRSYAERLGFSEDVGALEQTLEEEKEINSRLSELAERSINPRAAAQ